MYTILISCSEKPFCNSEKKTNCLRFISKFYVYISNALFIIRKAFFYQKIIILSTLDISEQFSKFIISYNHHTIPWFEVAKLSNNVHTYRIKESKFFNNFEDVRTMIMNWKEKFLFIELKWKIRLDKRW